MDLPAAPAPDTLSPDAAPRINLALQGGGSHGAFTWGVLDALLDDGRLDLEGLSGTSAGAMNAVAVAHGFALAQGKPRAQRHDAARQALDSFWNGIVDMGALSSSVSASMTKMQKAPWEPPPCSARLMRGASPSPSGADKLSAGATVFMQEA